MKNVTSGLHSGKRSSIYDAYPIRAGLEPRVGEINVNSLCIVLRSK